MAARVRHCDPSVKVLTHASRVDVCSEVGLPEVYNVELEKLYGGADHRETSAPGNTFSILPTVLGKGKKKNSSPSRNF